jgi:hypothetical protein
MSFGPEAPRKVRVTASRGGSFTRGNHFSTNTGRTTAVATDFRTRGSGYYGVNSALPLDEYKGPLKRAKAAPRQGKICPGCGIATPLAGKCNSCWD